ncbi:hypothetical protein B0H11DRAFT_2218478 [Mycena galericulata]|nr:hypothetical protein B0H11DRAFT_2218478 [Mycena galericulata]
MALPSILSLQISAQQKALTPELISSRRMLRRDFLRPELKRRYDQPYGVGVSLRSPYTIAALINGRQMYCVGKRQCVEADSQASIPSEARPRRSHDVQQDISGRPQTAGGSGPRKLRTTRSFSEMASLSTTNDSMDGMHKQGWNARRGRTQKRATGFGAGESTANRPLRKMADPSQLTEMLKEARLERVLPKMARKEEGDAERD